MGVPRFRKTYLWLACLNLVLTLAHLAGAGICYAIYGGKEVFPSILFGLASLWCLRDTWENWKKAVTPWWAGSYEHYREVMRG